MPGTGLEPVCRGTPETHCVSSESIKAHANMLLQVFDSLKPTPAYRRFFGFPFLCVVLCVVWGATTAQLPHAKGALFCLPATARQQSHVY
jgi:hypothetical protein